MARALGSPDCNIGHRPRFFTDIDLAGFQSAAEVFSGFSPIIFSSCLWKSAYSTHPCYFCNSLFP